MAFSHASYPSGAKQAHPSIYRCGMRPKQVNPSGMQAHTLQNLCGHAADGGRQGLVLGVHEHKVRNASDPVLGHLRRPFAVVDVQHHEVDLVAKLLLHLGFIGHQLTADLTPGTRVDQWVGSVSHW